MVTQFSFFDGEAQFTAFRQEDEQLATRLIQEQKDREAREETARNPSLLDFSEIDRILNSTKCPRLRCTRDTPEVSYSTQLRLSILRSFITLHAWHTFARGSLEGVDLWMKTPQACFENETPEVFSSRCWHCTVKWMKTIYRKKAAP